jgi:hypothetical protein
MPAILTEDQMELWLEGKNIKEVLSLLKPYEGDLEA